jgi:hypothetical protein
MNQLEKRALVRGLERAYPRFHVEGCHGGIRIGYVTPFGGVSPPRERVRWAWIQDSTWGAMVEQAGMFANSWGFLPVGVISRPNIPQAEERPLPPSS